MASTDSPRARAAASATARTKAGSLRFPRWGTGARYGPSVSTSRRSGGQAVRRSVIVQFLKVIMPLKEKYAAIAIPASNTPGPARVHDDRLPSLAGECELGLEGATLRVPRRVVVMVIEPGFPERHHFG